MLDKTVPSPVLCIKPFPLDISNKVLYELFHRCGSIIVSASGNVHVACIITETLDIRIMSSVDDCSFIFIYYVANCYGQE
jgi:hypothetical protein